MPKALVAISIVLAAVIITGLVCGTVIFLHAQPRVPTTSVVAMKHSHLPGIDGQAIRTTINGTAPLAGIQVYVVKPGFSARFEEGQTESRRAAMELDNANRETRMLEAKVASYKELTRKQDEALEKYRAVVKEAVEFRRKRDEFAQMGYNSFTFKHPLTGQIVPVRFADAPRGTDFQVWKSDTRKNMDVVLGQADARVAVAKQEVEEIVREMNNRRIHEIGDNLASSRQKATRAASRIHSRFEVFKRAVRDHEIVASTTTDAEGRFHFDLEPGIYFLASGHEKMPGSSETVWIIEATVPEGDRITRNLSKSNSRE